MVTCDQFFSFDKSPIFLGNYSYLYFEHVGSCKMYICYIEKVFEWLLEQLKWKKRRNRHAPHKETAWKILTQGLSESHISKHCNGVSTESLWQALWQYALWIGEGPTYRPFRDLTSVPKAGRPREQVEIHARACTQVSFLCKVDLGFFHLLEIVRGWLVPSVG